MNKNAKKLLALLLAAAMMVCMFTACGDKAESTNGGETVDGERYCKVGVINTGTPETSSWTAGHKAGIDYLQEKMPDLEVMWVEDVADSGADCGAVIDELVEQGCNLIFTTSYGFMEPTQQKAKEYPDVLFFHNQSTEYGGNMGVYDIRDYEAVFLTGYLTQLACGGDYMAYVGSNPMPTVIRACNAFALGAKYANEELKMKTVFVNSWYDVTAEKEAATALINDGATGFGMQVGSPAVVQACEENGIPCAGFSKDMKEYGPNSVVTSFLWNWGPQYEYIVKGFIDGTITEGCDIFMGLADGCGAVTEYNPALVTDEMAAKADEVMEKLKSGELVVFHGDMMDNQGNIHGEGVEAMSDEEICAMDWLVDFMAGTAN